MIKGGTGGNSTKTGAVFEFKTDLKTELLQFYDIRDGKVLSNNELVAIYCPKNAIYKVLLEYLNVDWTEYISAKLLPDEAVYVLATNTLYIIEKKFQQSPGSVDEKLQTCGFKKWQYEKLMSSKGIKVEYMYLLNDWFKDKKYIDTLKYIKLQGCRYYFNTLPLSEIAL